MTPDEKIFHEERTSGIGGSDIHHVFSLPPYGCARLLWYQKTGTPPDYEPENKSIFERGKVLEDWIVEKIRERYPDATIDTKPRLFRHPKHPELLVHTDANFVTPLSREPLRVLEAKTCGANMWFKLRRDGLPYAYILQIQHGMAVVGVNAGVFGILWPDGWKFESFEVEASIDIQAAIKVEALEFWKRVKERMPPDKLEPNDARCQRCYWRTTCQGAELLEAAKEPKEGVWQLGKDDDLSEMVARYWDLHQIAGDADDMLETVKNQIKAKLGTMTAVEIPGARIYYRPQSSMRVDSIMLKQKYPDVYERVVKPSPSRPLRIFGI